MVSIRFLLCLAVVGLVATEREARAADCSFSPGVSQPVFSGVQLQTVTSTCVWNGSVLTSTAHVARIDLKTKGLSLVTLSAGSARAPRTLLVSGAAGNQIAVNANLFTGCCDYAGGGASTALLGLAYGNGALWSPIGNNPQHSPPPGDFLSSLIVADGQTRIVTLAKGQASPAGLTLAVTGTHRILTLGRNTAPVDTTPADWFGPNARTVVGYDAGLNGGSQLELPRLWLVAVDAVQGASSGVTLPQAAELLLFLGASDGGGSTTMVRQAANGAATFVNVPKDWPPLGSCQAAVVPGSSCERYVGFGLGVVAPALP
jgi:hypothetical protein